VVTNEQAGKVRRYFLAILGREPDPGAIEYYAETPEDKLTLILKGSEERIRRVKDAYLEVLGREADPEGQRAYQLSDFTPTEIAIDLAKSAERGSTINKVQVDVLGYTDPEVLAAYVPRHDLSPSEVKSRTEAFKTAVEQVNQPEPPDPPPSTLDVTKWNRPRNTNQLLDGEGKPVRLWGFAALPWLCRRDYDPRRIVQIAAQYNCNMVRVMTALYRNPPNNPPKRELYVSPWSNGAEWDQRLAAMLDEGAKRGVAVMLVSLDEPDRNTKPPMNLPESESAFNGKRPSDTTFASLAQRYYGKIDARLKKAMLPELVNEPPPNESWMGAEWAHGIDEYRDQITPFGWSLLSCTTPHRPEGPHNTSWRDGNDGQGSAGVWWLHPWQEHPNPEEPGPNACRDKLAEMYSHVSTGYSTDGRGTEKYNMDALCAWAAKSPYHLEINMLDGPSGDLSQDPTGNNLRALEALAKYRP